MTDDEYRARKLAFEAHAASNGWFSFRQNPGDPLEWFRASAAASGSDRMTFSEHLHADGSKDQTARRRRIQHGVNELTAAVTMWKIVLDDDMPDLTMDALRRQVVRLTRRVDDLEAALAARTA